LTSSRNIERIYNGAHIARKFVIRKSLVSQFRFNLKASNREIIASSEIYNSDTARDHGIDSVKANTSAAAIND